MHTFIALLALLLASNIASATTLPLDSELVGTPAHYEVLEGEKISEIAEKNDMGFDELVHANPKIKDPLRAGEAVTIPTSWIIPNALNLGEITINLSEKRLFFPYEEGGVLKLATFPIAIGKDKTPTPGGTYKVIEKIVNPAWNVPKSIRREKPSLPRVVPPGPKNPLGPRALRLTNSGLMIHGTNAPLSIGKRDSHGCIRMYKKDIIALFKMVNINTVVNIVKEPVKTCIFNGKLYIEAHRDSGVKRKAEDILNNPKYESLIDPVKLKYELDNPSGIPTDITKTLSLDYQLQSSALSQSSAQYYSLKTYPHTN